MMVILWYFIKLKWFSIILISATTITKCARFTRPKISKTTTKSTRAIWTTTESTKTTLFAESTRGSTRSTAWITWTEGAETTRAWSAISIFTIWAWSTRKTPSRLSWTRKPAWITVASRTATTKRTRSATTATTKSTTTTKSAATTKSAQWCSINGNLW